MAKVNSLRQLRLQLPFFVLLSIVQLSLHAQKGLKRSITDGGDTSYYTTEKRIYTKSGSRNAVAEILKTTFYRYPNHYSLCFFIQTGRTSHFSISKGDEAILGWTADDNISVTCRNSNESKPSRIDYGGWIYVFYSISPSQLKKLQEKPIKYIRIKSSTGWMIYDISEKNAREVMEQAEKIGDR
ncbi:MAG: hypothetical protein NVV59_08735 [Chitinophagaceae bacterium]|nr:hypothetical protein [Chitinophagaceae bacterium]